MKYYDGHDWEYKRRLGKGQVAWDAGEYDEFDMRGLVERLLGKSGFDGGRVLDIGCGTGGLACYLTRKGFEVVGVDVSEVAIEAAKGHALRLGLEIDFRVGDFLEMEFGEGEFDLITDNHFLHCIVFDDERAKVLAKIAGALKAGGEYWLETMVGHGDMQVPDCWNLDDDGISWMAVGAGMRAEECVERGGKLWWPTRRIRGSERELIAEIEQAGLVVDWCEVVGPVDENDTGTFRSRVVNRD